MKYSPIDNDLFISNRSRFVRQLKPNSLAIFVSNDIMPTNADGTMPFRQNNDLFYLSGIDQEETILVLIPGFHNLKFQEMLFVKKTDEHIARWEGHKLTKEEATATSGVKQIFWVEEFENMLATVMPVIENVYLNKNEHLRAEQTVETRSMRFIKWIKSNYPLHHYLRSAPILHRLRSVKVGIETNLLKEACRITALGFDRVLKLTAPGVKEYEIEAAFIHTFITNRSRGFAYTPIVASGASACVLHYIENNKECKEGEVILMDVGAEYANYNADMTRCIPVSGRFTERQKAVYNAVLRVKNEATAMLAPGVLLKEYQLEVGKIMQDELLQLGLLDKTDLKNQTDDQPAYRKYFMHGTSHFLGLDVHDVGIVSEPMQIGNVFTVEPGIYIPEEGLGIRLEDNVVITSTGKLNLMESIPIEVDEIETIMNQNK